MNVALGWNIAQDGSRVYSFEGREVLRIKGSLLLRTNFKTYQELGPVWADAKRIAKEAKRSRVLSRNKNWRSEVLRAYPDLPITLFDGVRGFHSLRQPPTLGYAESKSVHTRTARAVANV